ncbi:MAG: hypothetical protein ACRDYB_00500 [Acidimicrobiales bacterium]
MAGVAADPDAGWVTQQTRNLCFELSERTTPVKFLIRGRDRKFPWVLGEVFCADEIGIVKIDRILILGRRHLKVVLADYARRNNHRPHQALPILLGERHTALVDTDTQRVRRVGRVDL